MQQGRSKTNPKLFWNSMNLNFHIITHFWFSSPNKQRFLFLNKGFEKAIHCLYKGEDFLSVSLPAPHLSLTQPTLLPVMLQKQTKLMANTPHASPRSTVKAASTISINLDGFPIFSCPSLPPLHPQPSWEGLVFYLEVWLLEDPGQFCGRAVLLGDASDVFKDLLDQL